MMRSDQPFDWEENRCGVCQNCIDVMDALPGVIKQMVQMPLGTGHLWFAKLAWEFWRDDRPCDREIASLAI